jgi:hypothetical protein
MAVRRSRKKQGPAIADPADVEEFATTIKMAWVECRSDGHSMIPHDVTMNEQGSYVRTRRCRRCGYKRHYVIDQGGFLVSTSSEYPDGYLMPKGTGRLDSEGRAIFRQATVQHEYERKANR